MEKLRLIIVDDEPIILEGLKSTYPWNKMGFEVVGTYASGEIALEYIPKVKPDVVLTDIRMKIISGIDLMKAVKEISSDIIFVIISAYRDFEYAKQACDFGAFSYLLKPVETSELQKTMEAVRQKCMEEKKIQQERMNLQTVLRNNANSYQAVIVERYLKGIVSKSNFKNIFHIIDSTLSDNDCFVSVLVDIDISYRILQGIEYEKQCITMFERLRQQFSYYYPMWNFKLHDGQMVYIINTSKRQGVLPIKILIEELRREFKLEIIAAVSKEMSGIDGLKQSYNEAVKMFEQSRVAGAGILFAEKEIEAVDSNDKYLENSESYVLNAIRKNDKDQFKKSFINFIYSLPSKEGEYIYTCIQRLALNIEFLLYNTYGMTDLIKNRFKNFHQNIQLMNETKVIDILYQIVLQVIDERIECPESNTNQLFQDYIKEAIEYIEEHLSDEELSITTVASRIYLNPVYFGRVFKSTMNINFRQYVMNRRMERAKKLILMENSSITNVCSKVGISNSSYFTQVFKQYTGYLPSEFSGRMI